MSINTIIFDFDGTLVNTGKIWEEWDILYLQKHHISVKEISYVEMFEKNKMGDSIYEFADFLKSKFALKKDTKEIVKDFEEIAVSYYKKLKIHSDIIDLFKFLKKKQINIALGTSNSINLAKLTLQENKVDNYFDFFSSGESGEVKGKPYPDIFLKIVQLAKVKPENCLIVEDSKKGIMAGKNAGMTTISLNEKFDFANYFAKDFLEVKKIINEVI